MELSVLIPTYQRPAQLGVCLRALARQSLAPEHFEVLVGFDGVEGEGVAAARRAWGGAPERALRLLPQRRHRNPRAARFGRSR
jgi:hypothetical protein